MADRNEIKFNNRGKLSNWLKAKPPELAQVIAERASLRVLPLLRTVPTNSTAKPKVAGKLSFAVFRAAFIVWVSRKYPELDTSTAIDVASDFLSSMNIHFENYSAFSTFFVIDRYKTEVVVGAIGNAATAFGSDVDFFDARFNSSEIIWQSIVSDARWVEDNLDKDPVVLASRLATSRLWLESTPHLVVDELDDLARRWGRADTNSRVWIEWYKSRLDGGPSFGLPTRAAERIDTELALKSNEWWDRRPEQVNADIYSLVNNSESQIDRPTISEFIFGFLKKEARDVSVSEILQAFRDASFTVIPKTVHGELSRLVTNRRIRRIKIGVYATLEGETGDRPELSQQGSGPKFSVDSNGALDTSAILATRSEEADVTQVDLLARLQRKLPQFREAGGNFAGRYPILADALDDYFSVIRNRAVGQLDIGQLWMAGAGLISQARAFAALDTTKHVTEPLEPQLQGLLGECARLHAALVMGFEEGRKLSERAQVPLLTNEELRALFQHEHTIVRWLLTSGEFALSDRAREVFERIDHVMMTSSESVEDVAMAGYPTLRNLLILAGHAGRYGEITLGRLSLAGVPVHLAIIGLANFLVQNAAPIMGIANSVPELRVYFEWLFERLEIRYQAEEEQRKSKSGSKRKPRQ